MMIDTEAFITSYCKESDLDRVTFDAFLTTTVDEDDQSIAIKPLILTGEEMGYAHADACMKLVERFGNEEARLTEMLREASEEHEEPVELSVQLFVVAAVASAALEHAAAVVRRRLKAPWDEGWTPGFGRLGDVLSAEQVEKLLKKNFPGVETESPSTFAAMRSLYLERQHQPTRDLRGLAGIGRHRKLVRVYCHYEVMGNYVRDEVEVLRTADPEKFKAITSFNDWLTEGPHVLHLSTGQIASPAQGVIMHLLTSLDE